MQNAIFQKILRADVKVLELSTNLVGTFEKEMALPSSGLLRAMWPHVELCEGSLTSLHK